MSEFYQQAHENLRSIERHIMRSKNLVNQFAEYRDDITRDQLIHTLQISIELTKWIVDNAEEL